MSRPRRLLVAAATVALTVLHLPSSSTAAPVGTAPTAERPSTSGSDAAGHRLSRQMVRWTGKGLTAVQMDRRLRRQGLRIERAAAYDRRARLMTAKSAAGDITLSAPFIIHDEGSRWYWMANYSWNTTSFSEDMPSGCAGYDRCDLLGKDAFGLAFDRDLTMAGYWATFGHRSTGLPSDRILDPTDRNKWGVVYKKQDTVYKPSSPNDLDMYHGNITVEIQGRPCGTTEAYSKYAHTYGDTNIPDVTINAGFIGFTFSSSEERWTKASQPGLARRNC